MAQQYRQTQTPAAAPEAAHAGHDHGHDHGHTHGNAAAQEDLLGGARSNAPASREAALRRHADNRARMNSVLGRMLARNPGSDDHDELMERNSAEWINNGEARAVVLTPIHDAHERPGVPAGKDAFFDGRKAFHEDGATYSTNVNDMSGIELKNPGAGGTMSNDGRTLTVIDPEQWNSDTTLIDVIVHEVQHDADQHGQGQVWEFDRPAAVAGQADRAPDWCYNSYASEFRAYWTMNEEGSRGDAFARSSNTRVSNFNVTAVHGGQSHTVQTNFSNKRQQEIFEHMYKEIVGHQYKVNGQWVAVNYAYLPHYYATDPAFKAFIDGLTQPTGGNLINSVRIQNLSERIQRGSLEPELSQLDAHDRRFLADQTASAEFWSHASGRLSRSEQATLQAAVFGTATPAAATSTAAAAPQMSTAELEAATRASAGGGATPQQSGVQISVGAGDTLGSLAARHLGSSSRWQELYAANTDIIGSDPNRLQVGMRLRLP
ncbi:MAG: LysM peptidoglycan-binding domain-containing protein [Myxococcota bacterium]|nr:LysM peptidoglycan-binding domain-containing protein [Myxococcota bacterium]